MGWMGWLDGGYLDYYVCSEHLTVLIKHLCKCAISMLCNGTLCNINGYSINVNLFCVNLHTANLHNMQC